jgi:hypothetical protein
MGFTRVLWLTPVQTLASEARRCEYFSRRSKPAAAMSETPSPPTATRQQKKESQPDTRNLNLLSPFLPFAVLLLPRSGTPRSQHTEENSMGRCWLLRWRGRGTWSDSTRQGRARIGGTACSRNSLTHWISIAPHRKPTQCPRSRAWTPSGCGSLARSVRSMSCQAERGNTQNRGWPPLPASSLGLRSCHLPSAITFPACSMHILLPPASW